MIPSILVILQPDLQSHTFAWCVRLLHMHRQIVMSHNLATGSINQLTQSKSCTPIAFRIDWMSRIVNCIRIAHATNRLSPLFHLYPIAILRLRWEAISRAESFHVHHASMSESGMNQSQCQVVATLWVFVTVASQNLALYDNLLIKMSLMAFAIFQE